MAARGRGGGVTPRRVVELLNNEVAKSSQAATARATGLTLQTVQRYIKGIGEPSITTLVKLADYFKVSVAWLRGDSDNQDPKEWELELNTEVVEWLKQAVNSEEYQALLERIILCVAGNDETAPIAEECIKLVLEIAGDEEDAEDNEIDKLPLLLEAKDLLLKLKERIRR